MATQVRFLLLTLLCAVLPFSARANVEAEPYVLKSSEALQELVAPVALYPDDLLAIVLPASTFPLQVVQAARFLEARDGEAKPDEDWDETIVALTNYPEALTLLNEDLDWTWQLGEAVLYQEEEVLLAVSTYRKLAREAGNLETNEHVVVADSGEHITIEPVSDDEIYVPYYNPEEVTHHHTTRVVHYYPTAYPVYYYPYTHGHRFASDYFWGVSTWYSIGWVGLSLHNLHHRYRHHPYHRSNYRYHYYRNPRYTRYHQAAAPRFYGGNRWRTSVVRPHTGIRPGSRHARHRYDAPRRRDYDNRPGRRQALSPQQRRAERILADAERRRATHAPRSGNRVGHPRRNVDAGIARGRINNDRRRDARVGGRPANRPNIANREQARTRNQTRSEPRQRLNTTNSRPRLTNGTGGRPGAQPRANRPQARANQPRANRPQTRAAQPRANRPQPRTAQPRTRPAPRVNREAPRAAPRQSVPRGCQPIEPPAQPETAGRSLAWTIQASSWRVTGRRGRQRPAEARRS